jgi:hypothetical protein
LKSVVVLAVNDRYLNREPGDSAGRSQTAEAGAHDYDSRSRLGGRWL